jgi:hypothetical protein
MQIADETAALEIIRREIESSKTATLAVAFWGAGAVEALGIEKRKKPLTVICNLTMGGTNPAEIRKLLALPHVGPDRVLQNNKLHAKIYHFDDRTIVGSSNASTNGLAEQGAEIRGWRELNVVVTDPDAIKDIEEKLVTSLKGKKIRPEDLLAAEEQWEKRRVIVTGTKPDGSLLDALRADPGDIASRNIYIAAYRERLSDEGEAREKKLKKAHGKSMGLFEGWSEMPREVPILCFYVDENDKAWPDGIWRVLPKDTDEDGYQSAFKRRNAAGLSITKADAGIVWQLVSPKLEADKGWRKRGYCCLPAQKLLA